jgi:hypothetical protein
MQPRRYKLVPVDPDRDANPPNPIRRRYSLARVGASSRSALGVDRLERMEEIAAAETTSAAHGARVTRSPSPPPTG